MRLLNRTDKSAIITPNLINFCGLINGGEYIDILSSFEQLIIEQFFDYIKYSPLKHSNLKE